MYAVISRVVGFKRGDHESAPMAGGICDRPSDGIVPGLCTTRAGFALRRNQSGRYTLRGRLASCDHPRHRDHLLVDRSKDLTGRTSPIRLLRDSVVSRVQRVIADIQPPRDDHSLQLAQCHRRDVLRNHRQLDPAWWQCVEQTVSRSSSISRQGRDLSGRSMAICPDEPFSHVVAARGQLRGQPTDAATHMRRRCKPVRTLAHEFGWNADHAVLPQQLIPTAVAGRPLRRYQLHSRKVYGPDRPRPQPRSVRGNLPDQQLHLLRSSSLECLRPEPVNGRSGPLLHVRPCEVQHRRNLYGGISSRRVP